MIISKKIISYVLCYFSLGPLIGFSIGFPVFLLWNSYPHYHISFSSLSPRYIIFGFIIVFIYTALPASLTGFFAAISKKSSLVIGCVGGGLSLLQGAILCQEKGSALIFILTMLSICGFIASFSVYWIMKFSTRFFSRSSEAAQSNKSSQI